ncbi:MAG: hypothetical protein K8U57_32810 [Planctomycetes bacterium]|nr:hypothetical protein [Planctomycetota bacterium]
MTTKKTSNLGAIRDRKLGSELAHVTVPADELMSVLSDQPKGPQTIEGSGRMLEMEVRRNEVWLTIAGPDAAVGLDDLIDAVAGVVPSA